LCPVVASATAGFHTRRTRRSPRPTTVAILRRSPAVMTHPLFCALGLLLPGL
jgi:hypothetical protein